MVLSLAPNVIMIWHSLHKNNGLNKDYEDGKLVNIPSEKDHPELYEDASDVSASGYRYYMTHGQCSNCENWDELSDGLCHACEADIGW